MIGIPPHKAKLLAENSVRWEPGLNDLSLAGLLATAGYLVAGALAFGAARRAPARSFERRLWALVCAALLALAVNKQLDLHILLIDWGRALALDGGLYPQRRTIQRTFMTVALVAAVATAGAAFLAIRKRDHTIRLALAGLVMTAAYALARASVFNHIGLGSRWLWLVELAGIALTGFAAWRYGARAG